MFILKIMWVKGWVKMARRRGRVRAPSRARYGMLNWLSKG